MLSMAHINYQMIAVEWVTNIVSGFDNWVHQTFFSPFKSIFQFIPVMAGIHSFSFSPKIHHNFLSFLLLLVGTVNYPPFDSWKGILRAYFVQRGTTGYTCITPKQFELIAIIINTLEV